MATQGLVTVRKDGKVIMKFVAGSDGYNAPRLASLIRQNGEVPKSLLLAYKLARRFRFGAKDNLVVMDDIDTEFNGYECLPDLYRETFDQPEFNPRWTKGTADYVEVIEL